MKTLTWWLLLALAACSRTDQGVPLQALPDASLSDSATVDARPDAPDSLPDGPTTDVADSSDGSTTVVPVWQDMPGSIAGCTMQRLANPSALTLFEWHPCDGVQGCEQAVYNETIIPAAAEVSPRSSVGQLGDSVVLAVPFSVNAFEHSGVLLAMDNGEVLDGFRPDPACSRLISGATNVTGIRQSIVYCAMNPAGMSSDCGGVIRQSTGEAHIFELSPGIQGGPGEAALGSQFWLWNWIFPDRTTAVNAEDGSGFNVLLKAGAPGSVYEVGSLQTTGPHFLIQRLVVGDGGVLGSDIVVTDGKSAPQPYLTPEPGTWLGAPAFAGSLVGWMVGRHPKDINLFESVELWASPYSPHGSELKPEKLGDLEIQSMPSTTYASGHGYFAMPIPGQAQDTHAEMIWKLSAKTKRVVPFPSGLTTAGTPGLSAAHVYVLAKTKQKYGILLRYALE